VAPKLKIYLEATPKRAFACAVDWPGWCRAGRDADAAIEALVAYADRYKKAMGRAASITAPKDRSEVEVVHRLKGNASTEYGIPGASSPSDERPISAAELKRLRQLLKAAWATFDRTAKAAGGVELRKGPRGGGRSLAKIVEHVREADEAYVTRLGARPPKGGDPKLLRARIMDTLEARVTGKPITDPANVKTLWEPRYAVRRSAWHALDHAWEIEDRR
jgi:hypothetical protein